MFLLIYYTAVGFALIYFTTVFGFSVHDGNALGNWNWGFNVIAVILFGFISDKLRVRKPLMILGGVGAAIMIVLYLNQIGKPTSYYHMAILLAALAFSLGVAYVPWMASFTETVEARNPALTATGLAIWGWIVRVTVFVVLPAPPRRGQHRDPPGHLRRPRWRRPAPSTRTRSPLPQPTRLWWPPPPSWHRSWPRFRPIRPSSPSWPPTRPPALIAATAKAVWPHHVGQHRQEPGGHRQRGPVTPASSRPCRRPPRIQTSRSSLKHGASVVHAAKTTGSQWKTWYWICFGGVIFFLLTVPLMKGRWSPRAAREDEEAHEAMVQAELAKLTEATV